jgi:major membrane immunogen (membrane-anchored lipoprotein)
MAITVGQVEKSAGDVVDFEVDYAGLLVAETIATSTWSVTGATADSSSFTTTTATIVLSGGTADTTARATNTITTSGARTYVRALLIAIR